MNRANEHTTHPMGTDTVNEPTGYIGSRAQAPFANRSAMTSQPLSGEANVNIPAFSQANQISDVTGEPIPNQLHMTRDTGIPKSFEEEDLNTRFSTVDTIPSHNVGHNTVGGRLVIDPTRESPQRVRPRPPAKTEIDVTGMPNVDKGNEKQPTTSSETSKNLYYSQYPSDLLRKDKPEEEQTHGGELSNQMAGGPNPDSESHAPSRAKHEVTEKEMYYVENTGNVNPGKFLMCNG